MKHKWEFLINFDNLSNETQLKIYQEIEKTILEDEQLKGQITQTSIEEDISEDAVLHKMVEKIVNGFNQYICLETEN